MSASRTTRPVDTEHDSDRPLCLQLQNSRDAQLEVWWDFHEAARLLLTRHEGLDFATFFTARHAIELGLKRLVRSTTDSAPTDLVTHSLSGLLEQIPKTHEIWSAAYQQVRHRIAEYHELDPRGDTSRYHVLLDGMASFDGYCCLERDSMLAALDDLSLLVADTPSDTNQ